MSFEYRGIIHPFRPSDEQLAIIDWVKDSWRERDLVVRACPGSGKTTTGRESLRHLRPHPKGIADIAAMTFGKENSLDLKRAINLPNVICGTIHSASGRVVRQHFGTKSDPDRWKYLNIIEALAQSEFHPMKMGADLRRALYEEANISTPESFDKVGKVSKEFRFLLDCTEAVLEKSRLTLTHHVMHDPEEVRNICEQYGVNASSAVIDWIAKVAQPTLKIGREMAPRLIDFTDMIWLLATSKEIVPRFRYNFMFVDECQDLNACQLEAVLKFRNEYTNQKGYKVRGRILWCGDENQAIMGFAGAMSDSMDIIQKRTKARTLPLSICRRCDRAMVEEAKKIIPTANIVAREGAGAGIIRDVKAEMLHKEVKAGDLIVCRLSAPLVGACFQLLANGITAKVLGRDVGKSLISLINNVAKREKVDDYAAFPAALKVHIGKTIQKILDSNGGKENDQRISNLEDQEEAVLFFYRNSGAESIEDLCEGIEALFTDDSEEGVVRLCTAHKSKGLESDRVFILKPDAMPLRTHLAWQRIQELNLKYVAYTRAKYETINVIGEPKEKNA